MLAIEHITVPAGCAPAIGRKLQMARQCCRVGSLAAAFAGGVDYQMIGMMRGVVDGGTGGRLRSRYGLRGQIAGKTGTTNDNSDGWFIGYTPTITAGVWVGAEDRYVHFTSTALGQGANMALPIWGIWMRKVLKDGTLGVSENDQFIIPEGVSTACNSQTTVDNSTLEDYYFE